MGAKIVIIIGILFWVTAIVLCLLHEVFHVINEELGGITVGSAVLAFIGTLLLIIGRCEMLGWCGTCNPTAMINFLYL